MLVAAALPALLWRSLIRHRMQPDHVSMCIVFYHIVVYHNMPVAVPIHLHAQRHARYKVVTAVFILSWQATPDQLSVCLHIS